MALFEVLLPNHPSEVTFIRAEGFYLGTEFGEYSFFDGEILTAIFPREQVAGIIFLGDDEEQETIQ